MRLAVLAMLALCSACSTAVAEEVLPIPAAIRGAARIDRVAILVQPAANPDVARLDQRASGRAGTAGQPLTTLLPATLFQAAQRRGIVAGRPLALTVEVDVLSAPEAGRALLGASDRMAGTVFIRDAGDGALLGQLYVDIDRRTPGLLGLAFRGGGVREGLVTAFAERVVDALAAPSR